MPRVRMMAVAMAVAALVGCTSDDPLVASAGGTPTATTATDPQAQELAFVACMREQGIVDMPDPVPGDTSGRSSVRYALDVMGKGSDMTFQAALDTCMTLLPQPPPLPPADSDAALQFAECMRDHGVPDFPDLLDSWVALIEPVGEPAVPAVQEVDGRVVFNLADPTIAAAWDACQDLWASDETDGGQ